jgi:hypothetical protein
VHGINPGSGIQNNPRFDFVNKIYEARPEAVLVAKPKAADIKCDEPNEKTYRSKK